MPPYEQKRNSRQILLKIVSSDEQKRNSPQILLKIVSSDEQKRNSRQILLKIVGKIEGALTRVLFGTLSDFLEGWVQTWHFSRFCQV